jgi:hypothetical protein
MRTQSFYFSSSPAAGAQNISADGSQFEVNFNTPLSVPASSTVCEAGLITASVWNTSPNISAAFGNNQLRVFVLGVPITIVFTDGLYSLENLSSYVDKVLQNSGLPAGLFVFGGDDATQRVVITVNQAGDYVDFAIPNSVGPLLGWPAPGALVGPSTTIGQHFYSPGEARLNRVNLFLITSDLVSTGVPVNALSRGVLAQVPITVNPGEQQTFQPNTIQWFDASELIGRPRMNLRFALTNQDLSPVPTAGETYSFVLQLRYG